MGSLMWGISTLSSRRASGSSAFMRQPQEPCLERPLNQSSLQKQHALATHVPRSIAGTSGGAIVAVFLAAARGSPLNAVGSKLLEILLKMPINTFTDAGYLQKHVANKVLQVMDKPSHQWWLSRLASSVKSGYNTVTAWLQLPVLVRTGEGLGVGGVRVR